MTEDEMKAFLNDNSERIKAAAPDAMSHLVEAARGVLLAYQEANPMRTADIHPAECDCLRCKSDWLDHVLGGFRKETDHDHA